MTHFRYLDLRLILSRFSGLCTLLCFGFFGLAGCSSMVGTQKKNGPSPAKSPVQELATFQVEPGFKVQLVAAEPMVQDPVQLTFDEDGRLWVVEMRGFMPTIDAEGEDEPVGRVSVLEDTNGDGQMDKSTIFLDSLIMPRALAITGTGVLIAENGALWLAKDTNGDLKADSKIRIDKTYAHNGLPEHTDNGLWRNTDNWYYNVKSRLRYRLEDGQFVRDSTEFRGQWGISHDDEGRLFYNYNWSQLHADLVPPNYLSRNKNHTPTSGIDHGLTLDRRIYPIRPTPAVNRGYIPGTLDSTGKLLEFTAACSPLVYRGAVFPEGFQGNAFVCEPSGNLIKRNVIQKKGFVVSAFDPHPGRDFLASTDERFRPVHLANAPDGALYVADMYRGLVQHGAYVTPYLREQTLSRKLVLPIHRGRIWRIVPENWVATTPQKLSNASSEQLIARLSSPNGWERDMAQRLLVERNDGKIIPLLVALVEKGKNDLGRFHALWTLEGMKWNDFNSLLDWVIDKNALVGSTALRIIEPIAQKDAGFTTALGNVLEKNWVKMPIEQVLQAALSARVLAPQTAQGLLLGITERYGDLPLMRDAVMSSLANQEYAFLGKLLKMPSWQNAQPEREIWMETLTNAIVKKGDAKEMTGLLAMLDTDNKAFGWQQKAILTAMAIQTKNKKLKPIQLTASPSLFARTDFDVATTKRLATASLLFAWPGHTAQEKQVQQSLLNEEQQQQFALGRQHYLTTCAGCHGGDGEGLNRFAPPLVDSDWVLGDEKRLSLIVLHGMEGPVDVAGKWYDAPEILPVMPAHSTMDDGAITAILIYIRNEWGNNAGPLSRGIVSKTRHTSQGRVVPWTSKELNQYLLNSTK